MTNFIVDESYTWIRYHLGHRQALHRVCSEGWGHRDVLAGIPRGRTFVITGSPH